MTIFTKKYSNLGSLEFFKNENFDACLPKIWIGTFKIVLDLWLHAVYFKIKKKKILHPTNQTEEKAKVVPAGWGTRLIPFHAALCRDLAPG